MNADERFAADRRSKELLAEALADALELEEEKYGWPRPELRVVHATDRPKRPSSRRAKLRLV